ncbi:aldo/keto reductase [bacterium]|nr:aldo/keto reductase [candidate division CSSED10-310 bacterium]
MQYRKYAQTGKDISIIGFGGMRFGKDDEEAVRVIHRAVETGINYFDTAPGYCQDRSESLFGQAFKTLKDAVYVSTKSSIYSQPKADDVRKRIDQALARMNIDRIHFFHMWCIMDWEHFERVMAPDGPYEGAVKARAEGLVEHIVFSTHANGAEIRRMCDSRAFEGITLGYNILNYTNRYDGILAAHENGMGVAIMNPLGGGMVPSAAEKLGFLIRHEGESVVQSALRFVLSHPEVTTALAGMGKIEHVEENAVMGDRITGPDPEFLVLIKAQYQELGQALCTACKYCLPCPENIDIPSVLTSLNYTFMGMDKTAHAFYGWMKKDAGEKWVSPDQCIDCGLCEERCTQHLEVRDLLRQALELFETIGKSSE